MAEDPDKYHNALGAPHAADQLRAYVTRVERLEEEIKAQQDDKKEVYAEAKACGFCVRTLKKLIARRRKDKADLREEDELLDLYEGIVSGSASAKAGDGPGEEKDPLDY